MGLFVTQACFSAAGIAFTMVMLYRGGDTSIYLPTLVSIISCWLPSPVRAPGGGATTRRPAADIETGLLE